MKENWKNEEIKALFLCVQDGNKKHISTLDSFREFAKKTNRNALSVRNFYYQYVKYLKNNPQKATELGIDTQNFIVQNFKHFDKIEEYNLKTKIDDLVKKGYSVRKACEELSNGSLSEMLRLQNKYRSITKHSECKVIKFPANKIPEKNQVLTDDELKSLFMGLVNLVKQNTIEGTQHSLKKYAELIEQQKRKEIVLLEQKNLEISFLQKQIENLKQKNKTLNDKLTTYRINFVNNIFNQTNY
jgi:hypothetical protein